MNYGVVAEFNPFHNGHKYLIDTLKAEGNTVTAVMSECFVQRGETAVLRPGARARAALSCGVDLVLSLPLPFAVSSAEGFASGAVGVLKAGGITDALAFGSECGNTALLEACANALLDKELSGALLKELEGGVSYPKARENALRRLFGAELSECLRTPNDTLAVEYIKASKRLGADFRFMAIKRKGALHDSAGGEGDIRSASEIRELLRTGGYEKFVPEKCAEIYREEIALKKAPVDFLSIESAVLTSLRKISADELLKTPDVSEGLENRLICAIRKEPTLKEVLESAKTKRYTYSRLKRIALCAFLGITKEQKDAGIQYIRVLGFNKNGETLLRKMKACAEVPVITSFKEASVLGEAAYNMYLKESTARDVFSLAEPLPDGCGTFMTDKIIKVI